MKAETPPLERPWLKPGRAILYGTLAVGILDAADALIFFGLRGASPLRIFQSIASGLLGPAAFQGGTATAVLGAGLHFFIAFVIMVTYYSASRRISILTRRPVLMGIAYGVGVYVMMNVVVVPLSQAAASSPTFPVLANGLLIHMVGVGLPCALITRAATGPALKPAPPRGVNSTPL